MKPSGGNKLPSDRVLRESTGDPQMRALSKYGAKNPVDFGAIVPK